MTEADLTRRIILSRKTYWSYKRFPGPMRGPLEDVLALITTEIDLLNGWAREFPGSADKLLGLVDMWEEMAVGLRTKAN